MELLIFVECCLSDCEVVQCYSWSRSFWSCRRTLLRLKVLFHHGELVVELVVDDLVEELVGELVVGDVEVVVGDVEVVGQLGFVVVEGYLLAQLWLKYGYGL